MQRYHPKDSTNELANWIIENIAAEDIVDAIFVSGSTSKGGNDDYSDVDINVVTENKEKFEEQLFRLLESHPTQNVILKFTPPSLPEILVLYFQGFAKFDFGIYSKAQILNKNLKLSQAEVITDKNGIFKLDEEPTNHFSIPGDNYISMAFADLIAIPREVTRNNIFEARANLDEARSLIATYLNLTNGVIYFGYADFINFANDQIKELIHKSLFNNDNPEGILDASVNLLKAIDTLNVFPAETINSTIERALAHKAK